MYACCRRYGAVILELISNRKRDLLRTCMLRTTPAWSGRTWPSHKTVGGRRLGVEESGQDPHPYGARLQTEIRIPVFQSGTWVPAWTRQGEVIRPSPPACLSRCGRNFPSRKGRRSVTPDTAACDVGHRASGWALPKPRLPPPGRTCTLGLPEVIPYKVSSGGQCGVTLRL